MESGFLLYDYAAPQPAELRVLGNSTELTTHCKTATGQVGMFHWMLKTEKSNIHLENTLHLHQFCWIFANTPLFSFLRFLQQLAGYIENFLQLFRSLQLELAFIWTAIFIKEFKPTGKRKNSNLARETDFF